MSLEGIADLPLHEGRVPRYLLERMMRLGSLIAKYIVEVHGPGELLNRLSDPFWFQSFNNVIGMDWNSSGSTTVVLYVLKRAFPPELFQENSFAVIGGKGKDAINTPREAEKLGGDVDREHVIRVSRLSAKIDGVALQDNYQLYIHGLMLSSDKRLLVIQQGMNLESGLARRYHIAADEAGRVTAEGDPHSGVASAAVSPALNLADERSAEARRAILDILASTPGGSLYRDFLSVNRALKGARTLLDYVGGHAPACRVNADEDLPPAYYRPIADIERAARAALKLKEMAPRSFDEVLLARGAGPETVRALALVAHLIYGYRPSFRDPTTHPIDPFIYAYAHGGKDGVPYRISAGRIERTVEFFQDILDNIKAGNKEKEAIARNLSSMVNRLIIRGLLPRYER